MESLPMATIYHFTHPGHPLHEFNSDTEFLCDGCKTPAAGKRYRCHGCKFDLHGHCGTCPERLLSFMHPHELRLLMQQAKTDSSEIFRTCNVCSESVEGLFYWCDICNFNVHPICTKLPESNVKHVLHPDHSLKLESSSVDGICAFCKGICSSWRYRCSPCGFDIHIGCITEVCREQEHQEYVRGIPRIDIPGKYHGAPTSPAYQPPPPYNHRSRPPQNHHSLPLQYHHSQLLQYHYPVPPQEYYYPPPQSGAPPPPYGSSYQTFPLPQQYGDYHQLYFPPPSSYGGYHNYFPPPTPSPSGDYHYSQSMLPSQPNQVVVGQSSGGYHYSQPMPSQPNQVVVGEPSGQVTGSRRKKMCRIVFELTLGVISSVMLGMDVTPLIFH